jgi:hypothetical protein
MRSSAIWLLVVAAAAFAAAAYFAIADRSVLAATLAGVAGIAALAVGIHKLRSTVPVTESETELSESGSPIYRHKARTIPFQLTAGDGALIDNIGDHIERHIGEVETVFHELVSDLVHVDVHFIPATAERDYHVLVTTGMSEAPMNVPAGAEEFRFAELAICLPRSWPLTQESFKDENNYWPVRWLKILARMPHEYDTWLGPGHTVPNGDPPEPFAENTKLCCWLIGPGLLFPEEFRRLEVTPDKSIHFYGLIPLYEGEVNFKLKHGVDALLDRFDSPIEEIEVLNPARKNFCA